MQPNSFQRLLLRNPLFFALALPLLMDSVLTLAGQGSAYWHNFQNANEISPTYFILSLGPMVYVVFACTWGTIFYVIMQRLKEPFNLMFSMGFLVYHAQGSSSWIALELRRANIHVISHRLDLLILWLIPVLYFALVAMCAGYCLLLYRRSRIMTQEMSSEQ